MKTKLIIFIVSFVVVAGGLTATAMLNSPKNVAARAISGLADDFLERDEFEPLSDLFDGGSIDFALTSIKKDNIALWGDSAVKGKIYFSDDALMLSDYDLTFGGVRYQGDAYFSRDKIYIGEENVLGDTYGVDFSTLSDDFSGSIFAPGSGSYYELDEDVYDRYIELIESWNDSDELSKDAEKLIGRVGKDIWKIFARNATFDSQSDKVRFGSEKTNVRLITIYLDDYAMQDIVYDVYDYLCESDDIYEFIEKYGDMYYSSSDGKDAVDLYEEWLDELGDKIEDNCDYIDRYVGDVEIKIATPKMSAKLLKLEVSYNGDTCFTLDCGKDGIKKSDRVIFETADTKITYKVAESGKKKFESSLNFELAYGEEYVLRTLIDKEREKFSLSMNCTSDGNNVEYKLTGGFEEKNGAYVMDVEQFVTKNILDGYAYQSELTIDAHFTFDTNDKMPTPEKNFKTIKDVTEKQLGKLESQLGYLLYDGSAHMHVDADDDYKCDMCRAGFSDGCDDRIDANDDGMCDKCGEFFYDADECVHVDADDDGMCDIYGCLKFFTDGCDNHRDADDDGRCDKYGCLKLFTDGCDNHIDADDDYMCDMCDSYIYG